MKLKNELIKEQNCPYCGGTGIVDTPNGEDDYDEDYCQCSAGIRLQKQNEAKEDTIKAVKLQSEMFNFVNKQIV